MPIDPERIRSDMTLELDDKAISMTEFGRAVDNFLGLVRDVSRVNAPSKDPAAWNVDVYEGSAGLGVRPITGVYSFDEVQRISNTVVDGLRQIASGVRPPTFTDAMVRYSKALASLVNQTAEPLTVHIWRGRDKAVALSQDIAKKAEWLLTPAYEDEGSVEGTLERANAHDKREFVIFDTLTNRPITCSVDDTLLREAVRYFLKRVEVLGRVKYSKDGRPVSVRATNIIPFPEPNEIPTLEEMRDLLKGA